MVWTSVSPDGTKSVRQNTTPMQGNTTYIETEMNKDHFWDIGVNEDGHHKFAQMPKNEADGLPSDPALAAGMDLVYYSKEKTATESPDQQDVQPFARCGTGVMQLLGIRACGVFEVSLGSITVNYTHNIKPNSSPSEGIKRLATGHFQVFFISDLPSVNYIVLGGAIRKESDADRNLFFIIDSANSLGSNKSKSGFKFHTPDTTSNLHDPLQCWFVCFGG